MGIYTHTNVAPFFVGEKKRTLPHSVVGKMTLKDKTKTFILNFTQLLGQGRYLDLCIRQSTLLEFFHSESTLGVPGGFSSHVCINPY